MEECRTSTWNISDAGRRALMVKPWAADCAQPGWPWAIRLMRMWWL
jgi:hypothetical protein